MHARAGDLAGGVKPRNRRPAVEVGVDAAAHVMRGRADRQRIPRKVEPRVRTHLRRWSETWRARAQRPGAPATGRLARPVRSCSRTIAVATTSRGARIARGVVPLHECLAVRVHEPRTFAAQRFAQQEPRRPRRAQHGRVELHELEVAHLCAAPVRHREAVAGRDRGIRRLAEHASGAAGGEQHGAAHAPRRSGRRHTRSATPRHSPSAISSVVASVSCRPRTAAPPPLRLHSVRAISRPVTSRACSTRRTLCAPSRASAGSHPRPGRTARPSRRARGRSEAPRARADRRPRGRTAPRPRRACRPDAVRVSRLDRWQPQCRLARTPCCSRRDPPSSAAGCRRGRSGWQGRGDLRCRPPPR